MNISHYYSLLVTDFYFYIRSVWRCVQVQISNVIRIRLLFAFQLIGRRKKKRTTRLCICGYLLRGGAYKLWNNNNNYKVEFTTDVQHSEFNLTLFISMYDITLYNIKWFGCINNLYNLIPRVDISTRYWTEQPAGDVVLNLAMLITLLHKLGQLGEVSIRENT